MLSAAYRYFYAIAEEGSIRRAAERIYISAPALSRQVKLLEEEFGCALIEYRGRRSVLTSAGAILREHIRQLMAQEAQVKADMLARAGRQFGHVRVACGHGFVLALECDVLPNFCLRHPEMTFSISVESGGAVYRSVIDEIADVGLMLNPLQHQRVEVIHASKTPLLVVMPFEHPLGLEESISFECLRGWPMAMLSPRHSIRQKVGAIEAATGVKLAPKFESNSYSVLKSCVRHRKMITILPAFAFTPEEQESVFRLVPLRYSSLACATSVIIARSDQKFSHAVSEFIMSTIAQHSAFRSETNQVTAQLSEAHGMSENRPLQLLNFP